MGRWKIRRVVSALKPILSPLLVGGEGVGSGMPQGGGRTYTSVVKNPVSSERKRNRMKTQQQIETGRNSRGAC